MEENDHKTTAGGGSPQNALYGVVAVLVILGAIFFLSRFFRSPEYPASRRQPADDAEMAAQGEALQFVASSESGTLGPWFPSGAESAAAARTFLESAVKEAAEAAWPPLPTDSGRSAEERQQAQADWMQRFLLESYEAFGSRDPSWDALATDFLTAAAGWGMRRQNEHNDRQQIQRQADRLEELGCTDPLVIYWQGNIRDQLQGPAVAAPYLRRALQSLQASDYPPLAVFYAARRLAVAVARQQGFEVTEVRELRKTMFTTFGQTAAYPPISETAGRDIYANEMHFLLEQFPHTAEDFRLAADTVRSLANPDPWAYALVLQQAQVIRAWEIRGGIPEGTPVPTSTGAFREELQKAYEIAATGWEKVPERPELPRALLEISRHLHPPERQRQWFFRAVEARFDYLPAYESMLLSLTPRRGNGLPELLAFAQATAETERYDTWVPYHAVHALHQASLGLRGDWRQIWKPPALNRLALEICEGYMEKGQAAPLRAHPQLSSLELAISWAAGQYERARQLYDSLGFERDMRMMSNVMPMIRMDVLKVEAAVGSGVFGGDMRQILTLLDEGNHADAMTRFPERTPTSSEEAGAVVHLLTRAVDSPLIPDSDAAKTLVERLSQLVRRERLILAYGRALRQHGRERVEGLEAAVRNAVGPEAMLFVQFIPPVGAIGRDALGAALDAVNAASDAYRRQQAIAPGSPEEALLDTHGALARLRWLLQANLSQDPRALEQYASRVIAKELQEISHRGLLIDFMLEWLRPGWIDESLARFLAQMVHARTLPPAGQAEDTLEQHLEPLRQSLLDASYSGGMPRDVVARHGNPHLNMLMSAYLREHDRHVEAAILDGIVRDWMWRFYTATRGTEAWGPWQCMATFNRVAGYEEDVVFYGQKALSHTPMRSTSLITASACLRLGWLRGAVWYLLNSRGFPDDIEEFPDPHGLFHGTGNYVTHLLEMTLRRKDVSEDNRKALAEAFPAEFQNARARIDAREEIEP